jgi:hypothetical protein
MRATVARLAPDTGEPTMTTNDTNAPYAPAPTVIGILKGRLLTCGHDLARRLYNDLLQHYCYIEYCKTLKEIEFRYGRCVYLYRTLYLSNYLTQEEEDTIRLEVIEARNRSLDAYRESAARRTKRTRA